jgi:hypothetical protein
MSASRTMAKSATSTCTEARVREVMKPVFDELFGLVTRDFASLQSVEKWRDDLTYMLSNEAISSFELQFDLPDGKQSGFSYEVSDDGTLMASDRSGGLRLHMLPDGTKASVVVLWRELTPELREEMRRRGWTRSASRLSGEGVREHAYSSQGYGVVRKRVGDW